MSFKISALYLFNVVRMNSSNKLLLSIWAFKTYTLLSYNHTEHTFINKNF